MRRAWMLLALLAAAPGCEDYTETVSCSRGTVLNDDDECVPPPPPDGGVAIVDCVGLCDAVAAWDAEQIGCLTDMIRSFGSPPPECAGDLTEGTTCTACVAGLGATDDLCATAGSLCQ